MRGWDLLINYGAHDARRNDLEYVAGTTWRQRHLLHRQQ